MRIEVMKIHHWASEWPEDYLSAYDVKLKHYECKNRHVGCSLIEEGPCLDEVGRGDYPSVREYKYL